MRTCQWPYLSTTKTSSGYENLNFSTSAESQALNRLEYCQYFLAANT